jgi:oligosaccharide repeat unit polymerase
MNSGTFTGARQLTVSRAMLAFALLNLALGVSVLCAIFVVETTRREIEITQISWFAVFVLVVGLSTAVTKRWHGTLLFPGALMGLCWLGPMFLHLLGLSRTYLTPLENSTWIVIIGTLILFNVGALLAAGVPFPVSRAVSPIRDRGTSLAKVLGQWAIYLYAAVGFSAWANNVVSRGGRSGLVLLSDRPDEVRWEELPKFIGQLPVLLWISMLFSLVRLENEGIKRNKHLLILLSAGLATLILDTSRSVLYEIVITGLLFWVLRRRSVSKKVLFSLAMASFLLFVTISSQRQNLSRNYGMDTLAAGVDLPQALAFPYIYMTSSISNLQLNLTSGRQVFEGGGVRTFGPILSWLQIYKTPQFENYLTYWPGGISLYQADLYIDFGLAGLILGPVVLGVFAGCLYRRWRFRGNSFDAMMYALLAMCVAASPLVNWFRSSTTWFFLILAPPVLWLLQGSIRPQKTTCTNE